MKILCRLICTFSCSSNSLNISVCVCCGVGFLTLDESGSIILTLHPYLALNYKPALTLSSGYCRSDVCKSVNSIERLSQVMNSMNSRSICFC